MSQRDFLRRFDAGAIGVFFKSGIADEAAYRAPQSTDSKRCTVLIDRSVRDFGGDAVPVATSHTVISMQLVEVIPERGGIVTVGDEIFILDEEINSDESLSTWIAING